MGKKHRDKRKRAKAVTPARTSAPGLSSGNFPEQRLPDLSRLKTTTAMMAGLRDMQQRRERMRGEALSLCEAFNWLRVEDAYRLEQLKEQVKKENRADRSLPAAKRRPTCEKFVADNDPTGEGLGVDQVDERIKVAVRHRAGTLDMKAARSLTALLALPAPDRAKAVTGRVAAVKTSTARTSATSRSPASATTPEASAAARRALYASTDPADDGAGQPPDDPPADTGAEAGLPDSSTSTAGDDDEIDKIDISEALAKDYGMPVRRLVDKGDDDEPYTYLYGELKAPGDPIFDITWTADDGHTDVEQEQHHLFTSKSLRIRSLGQTGATKTKGGAWARSATRGAPISGCNPPSIPVQRPPPSRRRPPRHHRRSRAGSRRASATRPGRR